MGFSWRKQEEPWKVYKEIWAVFSLYSLSQRFMIAAQVELIQW